MKIVKCEVTKSGYYLDSSGYEKYLENYKDKFPVKAYAFASADWHYDHRDEKCPHDAKIISITAREFLKNDSPEVGLTIELEGSYGGRTEIFYYGVQSYLVRKRKTNWPLGDSTHGEWLIDEVTVGEDGLLNHEIALSDGRIFIKFYDCDFKFFES
ncbi:hypothetical protein AVMA1855_25810 [Acidovorax sp. SUPP1855]|uniref:hypothetical protein n=1 Tax=Acidovorax sp. SUPP1855 TaxID=431774 RepID=UPI0023DE4F77|nr:hypothetical protein [Acidovorax sp. SUPP1855]GKS87636.1 hypothetical protein AVMA1855_25810 [Acidovorax sp. SUPP1855]